ncbi:M20 family metallopeptidase [soil metagenome]
MDALQNRIKELAKQAYPEVVALRRDLHAHPELSFEEHRTAAKVGEYLDKWGIPYQTGIAKTGVVALIKGRNPEKKTIALRADMDALPIQETNDVDYKSTRPGVMHACGHDVHTASVLGSAYILSQLRDSFEGTVKLIFQPSEEKLPGGASVMIAEGVLENPMPAAIYGQHVFPELAAGKVGFRPGMYMASADEIYVTVKGQGGHAALPHRNIDPVLIASHLIVALQQLVSRHADPRIPTVLSFGKVTANGATNVIPDEVKLEGTFRTLDEDWRNRAHQLMVDMAENLAKSMGGSVHFDIHKGYPFLANDPSLTHRAIADAIIYLGEENVVELDVRMTAEDFAWYTHHLPACFYRLGTASADGRFTSSVHTSTFNVDEKALETGMGLMAWLGLRELGW